MVGTTFTPGIRPPDKRAAAVAAPSLSIIVPTNQRRELVSEAVLALGEIHYAGQMEIIVVVDGSTDGTAAALRQVRCSRSLRVIEQQNLGAAAARNRGAAAATGDILLFLDDDMIADPGLAEEHVRLHRQGAGRYRRHRPPRARPGLIEALSLDASLRAWPRRIHARGAITPQQAIDDACPALEGGSAKA